MLFRTLISALAIVVGAVLIASWAVSNVVVNSVKDGTAVVSLATRLMDTPAVVNQISADLGDAAVDQLDVPVPDAVSAGIDSTVRESVDDLVHSEEFTSEVESQIGAAHSDFADALTEDAREPAPFVLYLDASPLVNDRIDAIPVVGSAAPDLALAPVPVEVLDAEAFEDTRTVYGLMEFAEQWFLWAGVALVLVGIVISPRKRWFIAKLLLSVGVLSLGVWAVLTFNDPQTVAGWLPGGESGAVGTVVVETFTSDATPSITQRMLWWGAISLAGSAVFALVAASMKPKRA